MNRDNKVLIGAVLVSLVIILIGANFKGITGNVVLENSETSIIISPEVVSAGESIYITVIPGPDGVNEKTSFYKAEDNLRKSSVSRLCNNYKCLKSGSFTYAIPSSWEDGVYYVKIYDYGVKEFIVEDFTVRN